MLASRWRTSSWAIARYRLAGPGHRHFVPSARSRRRRSNAQIGGDDIGIHSVPNSSHSNVLALLDLEDSSSCSCAVCASLASRRWAHGSAAACLASLFADDYNRHQTVAAYVHVARRAASIALSISINLISFVFYNARTLLNETYFTILLRNLACFPYHHNV